MPILEKLVWLARRNLAIDLKFIKRVGFLKPIEKGAILFQKYVTLIKHWFFKFETAKSHASIHGEKIYYNTPYGLVGYECMLAEQVYWISNLSLPSEPLIVDIGLNVGFFSLGIKKLKPDAKIFGFEPVKNAFDAASKNLEKYFRDVTIYNTAMGNRNGSIGMNIDFKETSFSHIDENSNTKVEMTTLDSIAELDGKIVDVLKLDVEGYELAVLDGAVNTLKNTRYLLMEINNDEYTLSDVLDILKKAGKKVRLLNVRNFELESDETFKNGDVLFELV